ncbi:MAG TPA: TetR/AcrR family transcriptional regulator [Acidimicrobiales bacterium]|jgi:AcrR family transcriptional regulator
MTVGREGSGTKRRIIDCTVQLLAERGSNDLRLTDVADLAEVGLQTIYYHFTSRTHLIAEAQAFEYLQRIKPLHGYLDTIERSLIEGDETTFWDALGENVKLSWSYGMRDDRWQTTTLLVDIWADDITREEFCAGLEIQIQRWVNALDAAKPLGWIRPELDAYALLTSCWAGSIGQAIFVNSGKIHYTAESVRDFFLSVARAAPESKDASKNRVSE